VASSQTSGYATGADKDTGMREKQEMSQVKLVTRADMAFRMRRRRRRGGASLLPELGCLATYIGYVSRMSTCLC
jgi:hypothetical protein